MTIRESELLFTAKAKAADMEGEMWKINHPNLLLACVSGSFAQHSSGAQSDIDVTTIMETSNPGKIDTQQLIDMSKEIRTLAIQAAKEPGGLSPVVIATIRLEEAQIDSVEAEGKIALPIHWLHYPSTEFAVTNEPAPLVKGLLKGEAFVGNISAVRNKLEITQPIDALAGLDWLTDSFRVFLANMNLDGRGQFQRQSFLSRLASHNLDYFWKWRIIADMFTKQTGLEFGNWKDLQKMPDTSENRELLGVAEKVREVRHQGKDAKPADIIFLYKLTFDLWPI